VIGYVLYACGRAVHTAYTCRTLYRIFDLRSWMVLGRSYFGRHLAMYRIGGDGLGREQPLYVHLS
jgi:hypothetical protein